MTPEETEEIEEKTPEGNSLIRNILWYLTLFIGLALVALYWGVFINIERLRESIEPWLPRVSVSLLTIFVANLFIKLTRPVLGEAYRRRGVKFGDWKVVSKIYTYIIWIFTGLIVFTGIFGSISSLGISIGILGAGLAFALQQPILSFSGWFLIMFKRPFTIGDRIVLNKEGVMGDVEDITMFFFVLKEVTGEESQTGKSVIVPNSAVFQSAIINYSLDTPHVWQSIPLSITYESDLALAEKLCLEAALKVAGKEMRRGARMFKRRFPDSVQADMVAERPIIRVEFADSSINLSIRIMCLPKQIRSYRSDINREINRLFNLPENKERVEIAYPHMELVAHPSFKKVFRSKGP